MIASLIDFVSNALEISKSCVYCMLCQELRYNVSADFVPEFCQIRTTNLNNPCRRRRVQDSALLLGGGGGGGGLRLCNDRFFPSNLRRPIKLA